MHSKILFCAAQEWSGSRSWYILLKEFNLLVTKLSLKSLQCTVKPVGCLNYAVVTPISGKVALYHCQNRFVALTTQLPLFADKWRHMHWSVFVVKIFQRAGSWPVWVFAQIIQRGSWPMWVVAQINQWGSWPTWVVVQIIQRESWPVLYKCNFLCLPEEQFKNFMHYLAGSCTSRIYLHDLWLHCYTYQTTTFNYNFNWKNGNIKLSSSDNL